MISPVICDVQLFRVHFKLFVWNVLFEQMSTIRERIAATWSKAMKKEKPDSHKHSQETPPINLHKQTHREMSSVVIQKGTCVNQESTEAPLPILSHKK